VTDVQKHDPIELKPLQFSLRAVLIVSAILAGVLAILAPWLREMPTEGVVAIVGSWILGPLLSWGSLALSYVRGRNATERVERPCHVSRLIQIGWKPWFINLPSIFAFLSAILFTYFCIYISSWDVWDGNSPQVAGTYRLIMSFLALMIASGIFSGLVMLQRFYFFDRHVIWGKNGLVVNGIFREWELVLSDQWMGDTQLSFERRGGFRRSRIGLSIAREDRAAVEELLDQVRPLCGQPRGDEAEA